MPPVYCSPALFRFSLGLSHLRVNACSLQCFDFAVFSMRYLPTWERKIRVTVGISIWHNWCSWKKYFWKNGKTLNRITLFALNNTKVSLYELKYKKETVLCTQYLSPQIAVLHYLLSGLIIISSKTCLQ